MVDIRIVEALERRFSATNCINEPFRIVFWHFNSDDIIKDLADYEIAFNERGWVLINTMTTGPLAFKSRLLDEPNTRFVVFQEGEVPLPQRDPFLDLRLCNPVFSADQCALYLDAIGLGSRPDLHSHIVLRQKFFRSQEKRNALVALGLVSQETPASLDLKMLAVILSAKDTNSSSLIIAALRTHGPDSDLNSILENFGLYDLFWSLMRQLFVHEEINQSLTKTILQILVSDLCYMLVKVPSVLQSYCLKDNSQAYRFCEIWRNDYAAQASYIQWSNYLHESLGIVITGVLGDLEFESIAKIKTFDVEKYCIAHLVNNLKSDSEPQYKKIIETAGARKESKFWQASEALATAYPVAYTACINAARFLQDIELFHPESTLEINTMADTYINKWYRIDQSYRLYSEAVEMLLSWDLFKELSNKIEALYLNTYLQRLSAQWDDLVTQGAKTLSSWNILPGQHQEDFYKRQVLPYLQAGQNRRVFVIISDALRYEVGQELASSLESNTRLKVEIGAMQSVLPSITKLGMAAILPHTELTCNEPDQILVDGKSTSGIENRAKILEAKNGVAIEALNLISMKRDEARALIKNYSLVYIYHDKIDAAGDKQASETQTFTACRTALDELERIVNYITNTLNGSHILITADHGFLFTVTEPEEAQKSALPNQIPNSLEAKKRFIIGKDMAEYPGTIRGAMNLSIQASDLNFLIPIGTQRFHFKGGSMFFHGGIMPQEVIIPLITVKPSSAHSSSENTKRKVDIAIVNPPLTITTRIINLKLIQTEPISETILARQVNIGIYQEGSLISDKQTIMANVSSTDGKDLLKPIQLHLLGETFNSKSVYRLSLKDEETGIELYGQDVRISLMITDEF